MFTECDDQKTLFQSQNCSRNVNSGLFEGPCIVGFVNLTNACVNETCLSIPAPAPPPPPPPSGDGSGGGIQWGWIRLKKVDSFEGIYYGTKRPDKMSEYMKQLVENEFRAQAPPNSLLFIQNGSFYNAFDDDADTIKACIPELRYTGGRREIGFPVHAIDPRLNTLTTHGHTVVLISQLEDSKGKNKRLKADPSGPPHIRREITFIDSPGLKGVLLAWFQTRDCLSVTLYTHTSKEWKFHLFYDDQEEELTRLKLLHQPVLVLNHGMTDQQSVQGLNVPSKDIEWTSASMIVSYLQSLRKSAVRNVFHPSKEHMLLDARTLENLNAFSWINDQPLTEAGKRCLNARLKAPLCVQKDIEETIDRVTYWIDHPIERETKRNLFRNIQDKPLYPLLHRLNRMVQADVYYPREQTITKYEKDYQHVSEILIRIGLQPLPSLDARGFSFTPPPHVILLDSKECGLPLKWSTIPSFRYMYEIPIESLPRLDTDSFHIISQNKKIVRFSTRQSRAVRLSYEEDLETHNKRRIQQLKQYCKDHLFSNTLEREERLKEIGQLDMELMFAVLAVKNKWHRPQFTIGTEMTIKDASIQYKVKNKMVWSNIVALTGSNGSGKSSWMKTVAALILLSHCGSYIPAIASIPLFKAIYLRFGCRDSLLNGESSWGTEVKHMNFILNHAKSNHAVFIDEFGRSTSSTIGSKLSYGVFRAFKQRQIPFVMFATHFTEVVQQLGVKKYCFSFPYTYELKEGISQQSHAYEVAEECGLLFESNL